MPLFESSSEEATRLYAAARRLSASLDLVVLSSAFRELIEEALPCDGLCISVFDAKTLEIRCAYLWSGQVEIDPTTLPVIHYDPSVAGMQSEVIRTGESHKFDIGERVAQPGGTYIEVTMDGSRRDLKKEAPISQTPRSALMAPIKLENQVLGVVQVMSHHDDAFGQHEMNVLEALISPLAVAFQNAALYQAAQREICERKAIEEALRASEERYRILSEELEGRVRQRTEALQRAVDEITGFSYSISHNMRSPIRAIVASSRILLQDYGSNLEAGAALELKRQEAAAIKLAALIDDLLQYARLGHMQIVRESLDLTSIAQRTTEALLRKNDFGPAHFSIEPDLSVGADRSLVEILLTILFENALKYRKGDGIPEIHLSGTSDGFCVSDDGIGFDMAYVDKLFQPFERLHRDSEFPGTGIGLANAKRIVELHEGRIRAESSGPGNGTTIYFSLYS